MSDPSAMSDSDLAAAYHQFSGGAATPSDFTGTRITVGGPADLSKMSDEQLRAAYDQHQPSTDYVGLAKAGGVGVVKGAIGLAGLPGDLQGLAGKAGDWLKERLPSLPEPDERTKHYAEKYGGRGDLGPSFPLPTSKDIQGGVEKVTGPFREPQNQAERDVEGFGEFVPGALMGGGGVVRNVLTQAALPAAAVAVAGRYSDQNPYVKALVGVLTGGAGAMMSGPRSANSILRAELPAFVTEQHINRAGQLIEHAQQRGVTLTWPEALSRVTGQPVLTDMQRIVESHKRTRGQMQEFFGDRPAQVENAARAEFGNLGGVHPNPSSLGPEAAGLAENVISRVRQAINQATRPSYDAARQSLVPTQVHGAMMADPLFEQALNAVRNDPARNTLIRGLSDRSTIVYDAVKQELAERSRNAASTINPHASQTVAGATGNLSGDVRNVAVAADRHAMGLPPGQGTGNLEHALAEQARLRETYLTPLQNGPLGKIADKNPTTQAAIEVLFPTNPVPHSQGEITTAVRALVGQRPAVAEQLVRAHAEMVFNEAARDLVGGANQFSGAKFVKAITGNHQQRANLQAAVEALPNGAARWQGLEQLFDILAATGTRQSKGSLTAFNTIDVNSMSGTLQQIAGKVAAPGKWLTAADDALKGWSAGRNLDGIAHLITDPRAGEAFREIARLPPGSDRALIAISRLIAHSGSATTEQRNKPAQK